MSFVARNIHRLYRWRHQCAARVLACARLTLVYCLLLVLLSSGLVVQHPSVARAASAVTEAKLSELTAQVASAAQTYQEATEKVDSISQAVSTQAAEIVRLEQEVLPSHRQRAAQATRDMYKMSLSSPNIVSMLLSSGSIGELIRQTRYLSSVQEEHIQAINALKAAEADVQAKITSLSADKDRATVEQQRASAALNDARAAQAEIERRAQSEDAQAAAAAAAAAQQAAELTKQMEEQAASSGSGSSSQGNSTPSGGGSTSGSQPNAPGSDSSSDNGSSNPNTPSQGGNNSNPTPPQGGDTSGSTGDQGGSSGNQGGSGGQGGDATLPTGWLSGVASHYGTGDGLLGKPTASGEILTDTSMGVAMLNVPLGTYVEIRYHGTSVIARVNDRGPYVHGRVIDMQPAVARALNFFAVGVDTVEYRFL